MGVLYGMLIHLNKDILKNRKKSSCTLYSSKNVSYSGSMSQRVPCDLLLTHSAWLASSLPRQQE